MTIMSIFIKNVYKSRFLFTKIKCAMVDGVMISVLLEYYQPCRDPTTTPSHGTNNHHYHHYDYCNVCPQYGYSSVVIT